MLEGTPVNTLRLTQPTLQELRLNRLRSLLNTRATAYNACAQHFGGYH